METYDYSAMRGKMAESGITQEVLAQRIGISVASLNNKLMGKSDFRQSEIRAICSVLGIPLSDAYRYFFVVKPLKSKA